MKEVVNMKNVRNVLWGIVLIAVGVIIALHAFGVADINIFFDGWWTLFIIVPCTVGLFTEHEKTGNLIGILIGVFLLLCCRGILGFDMLWKLAVPVIIIVIGLKLILGSIFANKSAEVMKKLKENGTELKSGAAVFSGNDMDFSGEVFDGAELNAVFGGVKCDLRNAVINKDCVINACAVFGGIDILVPENINVKINSNSIFGGTSNKRQNNSKDNAYTLYVNATCIFGGTEIK